MAPKKKVSALLKLQIQAGKANPAPPLGPALGSHGVNIMDFCKQYNAATQDKMGQVIPVEITVFEDRSFTFILKTPPAAALLKKAAGIEIKMVCPLHGFVWRKKFNQFLEKYIQWATYTPEETGVVIAYGSIYGNTANSHDCNCHKQYFIYSRNTVFFSFKH